MTCGSIASPIMDSTPYSCIPSPIHYKKTCNFQILQSAIVVLVVLQVTTGSLYFCILPVTVFIAPSLNRVLMFYVLIFNPSLCLFRFPFYVPIWLFRGLFRRSTISKFLTRTGCSPIAQPPTWRTRSSQPFKVRKLAVAV